ncbi:cation:proton antiporter [Microbacterium indicum]|uniref:cation:proton antiporter n=1 Tax=Microbacterium indicum TaxID=358100 RepID=UPI00040D9FBE|nr:sodium:proton antiporter [Microbacterium indicum]
MDAELVLVVVGAIAVAAFARWRGWPAPLLVTGVALVASLLPFVPSLEIDGHVLLNLTLPPLLYSAALDASFMSFRQSLPHIRRLGIGAVLVTALAVGVVTYMLMPEIGFAGAILLGAIVGPPDAVSAAAIGRKLGLPRRVMNVMSGESLINDATSLTLVRVFAAIVAGATVTVWQGIWEFFLAIVVGVAVGLLFGIVLHLLRTRLDDVIVTGTFGLLMPFGAYLLAEELHGSGVLAVVAMGFYVGYNSPSTSYQQRQQDKPLWHSVDFLLESFVFAYVGLQLPDVVRTLIDSSGWGATILAVAVLLTVLLVRPVFVFLSYWWGQFWQKVRMRRWKQAVEAFHRDPDSREARIVKRQKARIARQPVQPTKQAIMRRKTEPALTWQDRTIVSWAGMRGVVTLAMAAALPDLTEHAMPDGHVEILVAVAFVVTVGTLLLQGLSLPVLIRRLGVSSEEEDLVDKKQKARIRRLSADAGLEYLREQQGKWVEQFGEDSIEGFNRFSRSLIRIERTADHDDRALEKAQDDLKLMAKRRAVADELTELSRGWLEIRRQVVLDQCRAGNISEEVERELFDAMDAEELSLDTRGAYRTDV